MLVAELLNGGVHAKYNAENLPPIPAPGGAVDITGVNPEPEVGDLYDVEAGTFSTPAGEAPILEMGAVIITDITGPGVVHKALSDTGLSKAIVQMAQPVTVTALVPHPDPALPEQTWTTPVQGPENLMYATTHRAAGSTTVDITFIPTASGKYLLTETEINSDLDGVRFDFMGLEIRSLMATS